MKTRRSRRGAFMSLCISLVLALVLGAGAAQAASVIDRVRIVSWPTYDANNDGTDDTYIQGDEILVDVEFSRPVRVIGNVQLRLDVGGDDTDLTNSRKVIGSPRVLHGGMTLRFAYTVIATDTDTDGVWVQVDATDNDRVVFRPDTNSDKVVETLTGIAAPLTKSGLPTTGNARHKVNGAKTAAEVGPRPTGATVNGATLTVTFDKALTSSGVADSKFDFAVRGVDGIGADDRGSALHPTTVVWVNSTTLRLELRTAARAGEPVRVSYTGTGLRATNSAGGSRAPWFRGLAVTNNTPGTAGPSLVSASVGIETLKLDFDGALDESSAPAGSSFVVTITDRDDDSLDIVGTKTATVSGKRVTVILGKSIRENVRATVSYRLPGINPLQGAGTGKPAVLAFDKFWIQRVSEGSHPWLVSGAVSSISSSQSKVVLWFTEALSESHVPMSSQLRRAFRGTTVNGTDATVSEIDIKDSTVILTLNTAVSDGDSVVVTYRPRIVPLQDVAGNAAPPFQTTLSATAAGTPTLQSAKVDGSRVMLTYDQPLDPASVPGSSTFTLHYTLGLGETADDRTVYSGRGDITAVWVEGRTAMLRLEHPIFPCDPETPFTVTYAKPGTSPLQGLRGATTDQAAGFTHQNVTNARRTWCNGTWLGDATVGSVILRARRPFATDMAPEPGWFAVTASGGPVTVTGAAFAADDPHELKLTLDRELAPDETVTVSYTRPEGAEGLWDVTGRQLADLVDAPVERAAAAPAELKSAATEERGRGLILTFTKDIAIAGAHTDYTVSVDGARRATRGAFWEDNTVGLVLAEPVRAGQTVTVAYAKPASGTMAHDADRLAIGSFGPEPVENTVPRRENSPVTGAPVIEGAAQVGGTLTVSTAGVADADGLSRAAFAFQWISNSGNGDADIADATGSSLALTEALLGRTVKVRVTFTDDAGFRETLTSAATAAVGRPLTAEFVDVPAEHDGRRLFRFELRFSEDFPGRFDYRALRDRAFVVTGGQVREAKRIARGRNDRWTIAVRPASHEDVTVTLPAGSVTVEDGRTFANTVSATVQGPALLSVADATAREGEDSGVEFTVSLNRAASGTVTVDYATRDGTAVAGEDYERTRGTLTFAPGEREKTVSVPVLDDAHDEGEETFTLKLRNARGAWILDGEAVGTIENSDKMPKAWLARFGRTVAEQVVDAVGARIDGGAPASARLTLGGQEVDWNADPASLPASGSVPLTGTDLRLAEGGPLTGDAKGFALNARTGEDGETPWRELSMPELLLASSFHLASAEKTDSGPRWSLWGRGARTNFDGREGALTLSGDVTTGILGADYESGRVLAGAALALSAGDGSYEESGMRGEVESRLAGVYPYLRYTVSERLTLWGLAGLGGGDLTLTPEGAAAMKTDLSMATAAAGARGALITLGGFDLALRSDATFVRTESEATAGLAASEADTSRLRLALEGAREVRLAAGVFTPTVELGLRFDGGDAETGAGVELGGGLRYASGRLAVEVHARGLLAHEENEYEEWGVSASVHYAAGEGGRGLSVRAGSSWGAASGGADRLWSQRAAADLARGKFEPGEAGLDAEVGYGFDFRRGLLTPYTGVALSGSAEVWRAGARWRLGPAFDLALEASLTAPASGDDAGSGVLLKGSRRW